MSARGQLGLVGAAQDAGELDLPEAAGLEGRGGRLVGLGVRAEDDLGRRARGVRDDDGPVALAGATREAAVVGLLPAGRDLHAVVAQARPEGLPAVSGSSPKVAMVASRKARPGDDVAGFSTTSWSARAGSRRSPRSSGSGRAPSAKASRSMLRQTSAVSMGVTRCSGSRTRLGRHGLERGRRVRLEDVGLQGPREERVVDAVEHVGQGPVGRQDGLVDHGAGVAGGQHLESHVVLGLEGLDDRRRAGRTSRAS